VTRPGGRTALFCALTDDRIVGPGLVPISPEAGKDDPKLRRDVDSFEERIDHWIEKEKVLT
jgi:hypothetical protein